jgi:hypothetical protein
MTGVKMQAGKLNADQRVAGEHERVLAVDGTGQNVTGASDQHIPLSVSRSKDCVSSPTIKNRTLAVRAGDRDASSSNVDLEAVKLAAAAILVLPDDLSRVVDRDGNGFDAAGGVERRDGPGAFRGSREFGR